MEASLPFLYDSSEVVVYIPIDQYCEYRVIVGLCPDTGAVQVRSWESDQGSGQDSVFEDEPCPVDEAKVALEARLPECEAMLLMLRLQGHG